MKPASPRMKLTYDDYLLFPDDGKRHELIDGEHYVTPTPILRHQAIAGRLHLLIASYLKAQPLGRVFFAPLDVILSRFDVVEPDLLYVSRDRCADLLKDWVRGAPDLVVEIGSPSTRRRDETIKRTCTSARASSSTGSSIRRSMSSACTDAVEIVSSGRWNCRAQRVTCSRQRSYLGSNCR